MAHCIYLLRLCECRLVSNLVRTVAKGWDIQSSRMECINGSSVFGLDSDVEGTNDAATILWFILLEPDGWATIGPNCLNTNLRESHHFYIARRGF